MNCRLQPLIVTTEAKGTFPLCYSPLGAAPLSSFGAAPLPSEEALGRW